MSELVYKTVQVLDNIATGYRMRSIRQLAGLSLRHVARKMGFSAPYVSDLELGRRSWSEELAEAFLKALKRKRKQSK